MYTAKKLQLKSLKSCHSSLNTYLNIRQFKISSIKSGWSVSRVNRISFREFPELVDLEALKTTLTLVVFLSGFTTA